jgi:hypothetical protein
LDFFWPPILNVLSQYDDASSKRVAETSLEVHREGDCLWNVSTRVAENHGELFTLLLDHIFLLSHFDPLQA